MRGMPGLVHTPRGSNGVPHLMSGLCPNGLLEPVKIYHTLQLILCSAFSVHNSGHNSRHP